MRSLICLVVFFSIWGCTSKKNSSTEVVKDSLSIEERPVADSADYIKAGFDLLENEYFGAIKTGLFAEDIIKILGEPESKSVITLSEVDGMNSQTWYYSDNGIEISFSQNENQKWFSVSYLLQPNFILKSSRGVGIGSLRAEVVKAYEKEIGEEAGPDQVVAGTLYGGIVFWLENGRVKNIFVGASAE